MDALASDVARLFAARLISWDVDGTLYELPRVVSYIKRRALFRPWQAGGLRRLERLLQVGELRRKQGGLPPADIAERVELECRYLCPALRRAGVAGGVLGLIEGLAARQVQQVVLSDYAATHKLEALGLAGRFAKVYAAEEMGLMKPSPVLMLRVARDHGLEPRDIVHIGDRLDTDALMTEGAGAHFILAGPSLYGLGEALSVASASSSKVVR